MKRFDVRFALTLLAAGLGSLTLILAIVYVIKRDEVERRVRMDLTVRRDALQKRIEVLIEAERKRLAQEHSDHVDENENLIVGKQLLVDARRVHGQDLYTAVIETGEPRILVAVPREPNVYLTGTIPKGAVEDAMAEVCPRRMGHVYITDSSGRPLFRWPDGSHAPEATRHQKFRRSTEAFRAIKRFESGAVPGAAGQGTASYKNLDDRDAMGAFGASDWLHGGIVVEQAQSAALASVRGIEPWHVFGVLFVLCLLPLGGVIVAPKVRIAADLMRLYTYARRYWFLILCAVVVMIVYAGGNALRLALLKQVIDGVLLGKGAGAVADLEYYISIFAVIVVVMAAASWVKEYLSSYVTQAIVNDIRCALAAHLITLDLAFFDRQKAGEIMSRLSNDVNQTRRSLSLIFGEIFQEPLMLVGALGAAFVVNWRLTLLIFLGLPLIVLPVYRLGRLVKKYSKRRQVQRGIVTEVMLQTVSGARIVKAFQMEEYENRRLDKASRRLLKQSVRVARTTALSKMVIDLSNSVGALIILALGGYMVIYAVAGVTASDLMTLSIILAQMYKPVKDLTKTYNKVQESMAGADRIFEIMDVKPELVDRPGARWLDRPERDVAFEHVSFSYGEKQVLKDISFRADIGEVVALVGETGAGKSTLVDIVARFYDPTDGRVLLDGVDLRDYQIQSLRKNIAIVSQDAFLFNASVRENILYGRPDATERDVVQAARAARIHDEIMQMDRGYETQVGDRGTRLSGGQRQRLTIARAILKDAPILVLDEATSALDSETEALVQEALNRLMNGRTTFVIAHRLSTIGHADRILVMKEGELVEQGTHEELLEKDGGVYRSLHRIQFATA